MNVGLTTPILAANEAAVAVAARSLRDGGLVAFPTETVYGRGADASNAAAIARLYEAKGRPAFNPLIAHVGDLAAAQRVARFDAQAILLAKAFWPGPLTLVLPKAPSAPSRSNSAARLIPGPSACSNSVIRCLLQVTTPICHSPHRRPIAPARCAIRLAATSERPGIATSCSMSPLPSRPCRKPVLSSC